MKLMTKLLLAAAYLTITVTSFAAQPASFGPGMQGFYLGADAGLGRTSCSACSSKAANVTGSTIEGGLAGTIFAGYQLNSYLAIEAGWGALPQLRYNLSWPGYASDSSANQSHFYGAIKGMYPFANNLGVFGKVGYDYMTVSSGNVGPVSFDSMNPTGVLLAIGGSYNFTPKLAATIAYNQILDSVSKNGVTQNVNVGYGTLGLTYSF